MFAPSKKIVAILFAAALGMNANVVLAEEHNHEHHQHHDEGTAQLTLNDGNKWDTDANLRQAMSRIRHALSGQLHVIHSGKATTKQYQTLAQKINDEIAFMVKNCKLDPKADEMLHLVLADIIGGADAMAGNDPAEARAGAEMVAAALEQYGAFFNHADWQGVHSH